MRDRPLVLFEVNSLVTAATGSFFFFYFSVGIGFHSVATKTPGPSETAKFSK